MSTLTPYCTHAQKARGRMRPLARPLTIRRVEVVMRAHCAAVFLLGAVLFPKLGNAQAYYLPTPPPQVTAANVSWQLNGEPVFYEGDFYYPTGPTIFFDGNVMRRSAMYR